MHKGTIQKVLDHGYVKLVDYMGSDESVIESARMSTGKGFFSWIWEEDTYADVICDSCNKQHLHETLPKTDGVLTCTNCWETRIIPLVGDEPNLIGKKGEPRDLSLLEFLMMNRHSTPFEMGEICIEVQAPLMVFREWHRHRTQSYNEFSARYAQMPNLHYVPELERFLPKISANKQESSSFHGTVETEKAHLEHKRGALSNEQQGIYTNYESMLGTGVPKEVARLNTPVSRYSKMRAKTDLRNWLAFLSLRMEKSAQKEIQAFALAVAEIIRSLFPRSYALWVEHEFLAVRFSRKEMRLLRACIEARLDSFTDHVDEYSEGLTPKEVKRFMKKITEDKEELYSHIPGYKI